MSGPLASWVSQHCKGDRAVVDVVRELALASYHNGYSAYAPTWDELAHRTRTSRSTVAAALSRAEALGVISQTRPGRGRGVATIYRVHFDLCDPDTECRICPELQKKVQPSDLNGVASPGKGPVSRRKGPATGPTTVTNHESHSQRLARLQAEAPRDAVGAPRLSCSSHTAASTCRSGAEQVDGEGVVRGTADVPLRSSPRVRTAPPTTR